MFIASRRLLVFICASVFVLLTAVPAPAGDGDWPQWRGPTGDGVCTETNLPTQWSEESGIAWKCKLPEWGYNTPVIWRDALFLTSHVDDEKLVLLRINKKTGKIEWTRQVGAASAPRMKLGRKSGDVRRHQKFHADNNLASPSPVTDGETVVVHFGNGDLAAYDFDGKQLWHRNLQKDHGDYTIWWGHANSPVLYGDLVISVCMQDSCADLPGELSPSYVVAHDKKTGVQQWKTMRMTAATAESCDSYITPILIKNNGRTEMAVMGGQMLDAYDPTNGRQLWHLPGLEGNRTITGIVAAHGMVYLTQGMRRPMLAVRAAGTGKLSREKAVAWQHADGTPDASTPVVSGELLFMVANTGIAQCLNARTGKLQWKERLPGNHRASPIAADGKIYFLNTQGVATVVAASPEFKRLAENRLDDATFASPVVSDGKIYLRGRKSLYCIDGKG